jgi:hypothetical protein
MLREKNAIKRRKELNEIHDREKQQAAKEAHEK